jgi:hypothetical protein
MLFPTTRLLSMLFRCLFAFWNFPDSSLPLIHSLAFHFNSILNDAMLLWNRLRDLSRYEITFIVNTLMPSSSSLRLLFFLFQSFNTRTTILLPPTTLHYSHKTFEERESRNIRDSHFCAATMRKVLLVFAFYEVIKCTVSLLGERIYSRRKCVWSTTVVASTDITKPSYKRATHIAVCTSARNAITIFILFGFIRFFLVSRMKMEMEKRNSQLTLICRLTFFFQTHSNIQPPTPQQHITAQRVPESSLRYERYFLCTFSHFTSFSTLFFFIPSPPPSSYTHSILYRIAIIENDELRCWRCCANK